MKLRPYYLVLLMCLSLASFAQVGIGTNTPEASSILDVESTTRGFLLPRVNEHTDVNNPAIGLMVYDLTDHCINLFIGDNTWKNLCESTSGGGGTGIITVPPTNSIGEVNLSTKICFDVAETNDIGDGCGALQMRTPIEADFTDAGTHTQTLTISATVDIKDIVVSALDASGKVILNANPPLVDNILSGESTTATIEYKQDLNTEATGLKRADRLSTTIYVTYEETSSGLLKQVEISPFVQDCACSQKESTNGEHHFFINDQGELFAGQTRYNYLGAVGIGRLTDPSTLNKVTGFPAGVKIIDISYGPNGSIALGDNGVPYVSGDSFNPLKNFGVVSNTFINEYTNLNTLLGANAFTEKIIDVAVGYTHCLFLTESLKLYSSGGAFGDGQTTPYVVSQGNLMKEVFLPNGATPVVIHANRDMSWVLDDEGNAYATGRNYYNAMGINATIASSLPTNGGVHLFTKLQLAGSPTPAFGAGLGTAVDFPSPVLDIAGQSRATAVLLENGDIYYAGENTYINNTVPKVQQIVADALTCTSIFGKIPIDGDAVTMGNPLQVFVFTMNEEQQPNNTTILYVLDDKGDIYAKGGQPNNASFDNKGGWGNTGNQVQFKKLDLSALNGERVVTIKQNYNISVIVTDAGNLYYTGKDHTTLIGDGNEKLTFVPATQSEATGQNWIK